MSTPASETSAEARSLLTVQRRVGAIGFFAVIIHGVFGLIGAAHVIDGQGRHSDATLLLVMSGVFGLVTFAGVRLILGRSLWSPFWIVLSLLPTVVAFIVI